MINYVSVLALEVKSTIYKMFAVFTVMAAAQLIDFYLVLQESMQAYEDTEVKISFEDVFRESHTNMILCLALCVSAFILVWAVSEKRKVKSKGFLWRLSVERKQIAFLQAGYHILCFALLSAVQIITVSVMYQIYYQAYGVAEVNQALLMAFYRNNFLHNILPMSDWFGSLRLLVTILLCGMGTVYMGYTGFMAKGRTLSLGILYLSIWMWTIILSGAKLFTLDVLCIICSIGALVMIILSFLDKMGELYYEG